MEKSEDLTFSSVEKDSTLIEYLYSAQHLITALKALFSPP